MTTTPTLKVEVAWNDPPMVASPVWTDISSSVRSGQLRRGRSNELENVTAGTLSLVLDSRQREYDPFYTAGSHYGQLTARRQIRVSAVYGATTYPLFRGYVRGWPLAPDLGGDNTCQVDAFDGLAYLGGITLPADYFTYRMRTLGPDQWWPMGTTDQTLANVGYGPDYTLTTPTPATDSAATQWLTGSATSCAGTTGAIGPVVNATTPDHTTVFLFRTATAGPAGSLNPVLSSAGTAPLARIGINAAGLLEYSVTNAGTSTFAQSTIAVNDDAWHLGAVVHDTIGGQVRIYVDGYDRTDTGASWVIGPSNPSWACIAQQNPTTGDLAHFDGSLQHVAIFNSALSATDVAGLAVAGFYGTPYAFTRTDQFVGEVLDAAGWPSAQRTLSTGTVTPGGMKWGTSALSVLQTLAATEGGRLYIDATGNVVFTNADDGYTATRSITSQATYSDSGAAGTITYSRVDGLELSDDFLANSVTVNTAQGVGCTYTDSASVSAYGLRARTVDTYLNSQQDALTRAAIIASQYANPQLRLRGFTVMPIRNANVAMPKVLATELGDRITWELQPQRLGARISKPLNVEQVQHTFAPGQWTTILTASPALTGWTLADTAFGILESTTVLA